MPIVGWILVVLGAIVMVGTALYTRRRGSAIQPQSGQYLLYVSLVATVVILIGLILEAIAAQGLAKIPAIVAAVVVGVLVAVSGGAIVLRLRTPQLTNIDIGRDGLLLTYSSGLITMRWEDIATFEVVKASSQLPGGISYKLKQGSASDKARPFQVRLVGKISRAPYDGLLAMPPEAGSPDQLLKRLRHYWIEPGSRRELPVEGMGTVAAAQGAKPGATGPTRVVRRMDRRGQGQWPPQPRR